MSGEQNSPRTDRREWSRYGIFLKKDYAEVIRLSRGWPENGFGTLLGEALGVTRHCANHILNQDWRCSDTIIGRIAALMNLPADSWHLPFELRTIGAALPGGHAVWNAEKYDGVLPYEKYSIAALRHEPPAECKKNS